MQCLMETDSNSGNVKMKNLYNYKNPYKKESNLDHIVDQLCTRLQDIKDQTSASVGMPTCSIEQAEAVRRYYAAFPALKKGRESPLQYYLPPPAWCEKSGPDIKVKMQSEISMFKDWNARNKRFSTCKERRNSYHGQRKNKKRCNSYSRSFDGKESLPEWVTHEGAWDMDTQDPVKEFIRAIALDEGYGTCENTVTDEVREISQLKFCLADSMVPDWDDSLDLDAEWVITEDLDPKVRTPTEEELYAKFEAKFDRSIEALWAKGDTPDDDYQDLPIDFQDLLSSPSDHMFADSGADKCSLVSLDSIWASEGAERGGPSRGDCVWASEVGESVPPMHLALRPPPGLTRGPPPGLPTLMCRTDAPAPAAPPAPIDAFAFYEGDEIYDALARVAETMRSFTAINHSRERSSFAEVPPRRGERAPPPPAAPPAAAPPPPEPEDLLTSARTHFRPIRREPEADAPRYADGDAFDIRGDLDPVEFRRSDSGGVYLGASSDRYLEYRGTRTIDYGRLQLTAAQRCPDLEAGLQLRFPLRQRDVAVQAVAACPACARAAKKMRPSHLACACAPAPALEMEEAGPAVEGGEGEGAAEGGGERKRRHSAALRCAAHCAHPHARFLPCPAAAHAHNADRPLTR